MADFEADAKLQETVREVYSHLDHLRNTHIVKAHPSPPFRQPKNGSKSFKKHENPAKPPEISSFSIVFHRFQVPDSFQPLSSVNSRGCCTSAARFLCSEELDPLEKHEEKPLRN